MDRRCFLASSGSLLIGHALPAFPQVPSAPPARALPLETFEWEVDGLRFRFQVLEGRLRQTRLVLADTPGVDGNEVGGVEVAVQCDGQNSPDGGMKLGVGQPGLRLLYTGKRQERNSRGELLVLSHRDERLHLQVESHYQSFRGTGVVRRWTRLTNAGSEPVGISYVSSAMLHDLAPAGHFDEALRIHLAYNSWMSEGQWHSLRPSELGLVENERTSWSEASAGSIGSWSSGKYLPLAMVENVKDNLTWFWQVEHNGSWYWEISNTSARGNVATDVYAYLGGPDDLHADAWKHLLPGQAYETVPVAIGCVKGGFAQALAPLTRYRRGELQPSATRSTRRAAVTSTTT